MLARIGNDIAQDTQNYFVFSQHEMLLDVPIANDDAIIGTGAYFFDAPDNRAVVYCNTFLLIYFWF